jgi:hypothetical protein
MTTARDRKNYSSSNSLRLRSRRKLIPQTTQRIRTTVSTLSQTRCTPLRVKKQQRALVLGAQDPPQGVTRSFVSPASRPHHSALRSSPPSRQRNAWQLPLDPRSSHPLRATMARRALWPGVGSEVA